MAETHTIRPMEAGDIEHAADVMVGGGWGDRRRFLQFTLDHPGCTPLVADVDGQVVGTGVATVNGAVGWIGMIFVDEALRGRGIGTALTEAVIGELTSSGCSSFALVATPLGRPIYERLGFRADMDYRVIAAAGLGLAPATSGPGSPGGPRLRTLVSDDLPAVLALDRAATGEDRAHLLLATVEPGAAVVALDPEGRVAGFEARSAWGGHPTIAPEVADGVRLLEHRRARTAAGVEARTALPEANRAGLTALEDLGWQDERGLVRMVRGAPIHWQPSAIWGQFSYAIG
jgi:GNAT superfamily N-acetyltransferase